MESCAIVFWLSTTCYLTCILSRNTADGSMPTKVFTSINDSAQQDASMLKIEDTGIEQSIETETRPDGIILKDDSRESETSRESTLVKDRSEKMKTFSSFENARCSRYCIQQLRTGKDNSFGNIHLFWSFVGNESKEDNFSKENNPNLKIFRRISTNNKNSMILDNCEIYLNLGCNIINMDGSLINEFYSNSEFNGQGEDPFRNTVPEFSKEVVHRINLSGYTETNFHLDADVTGVVINIWRNLTSAIVAIPTNRTMQRPGIAMSLARTYDTKGVVIGARNLLHGGWCVKLTGAENSNYNLDVIAYFGANEEKNARNKIIDIKSTTEFNRREDLDKSKAMNIVNKTKQFSEQRKETHKNAVANKQFDSTILMNNKLKFVFERSVEIIDPKNNNEMVDDSIDALLSSEFKVKENNLINQSVLQNNSLKSYGDLNFSQNESNNKKQQQKIQSRSSEVVSLNEKIDTNVKTFTSKNVPREMMDSDQILSKQFAKNNNEDFFKQKKELIEVNTNSNLIATPGTTHRVTFDVMNNCVLPVRYAIRATSSPLRIYSIQPIYMWVYPKRTGHVAVDILVPLGSQDTVNTVTLSIDGTEIYEKTVYVYVQNAFSKNIDNVKPTIEYSFNSNCAGKLDKDRCEKTLWSADITVQDSDSGLKRIISTPNEIYPYTKFISGTKERIKFYYSSTCCSTTATITAIDVSENQYSRTIDVTAWDNLSQGDIAAISLGALLLLLLLIVLIIGIICCVRKRSSHDLPYTQRYGSRPPVRSERTSF